MAHVRKDLEIGVKALEFFTVVIEHFTFFQTNLIRDSLANKLLNAGAVQLFKHLLSLFRSIADVSANLFKYLSFVNFAEKKNLRKRQSQKRGTCTQFLEARELLSSSSVKLSCERHR